MASTFALKQYIIIFTFLVICASNLEFASCRVISEASMRERHDQWMTWYRREYKDGSEKEERYKIFKANAEYIDFINNDGNRPYKLNLNQFADITNDEFKRNYMSCKKPFQEKSVPLAAFSYENFTGLPSSIDWRKRGAVTPIRDGTCGAWAFPSVDTVEGITKIKDGKLYRLSVQEIVDCEDGSDGCDGGFVSNAFNFIKQHGLTTESNYPSNKMQGTCDKKKESEPVATIIGYEKVPSDNEKALMKAVANQPVAVSVDASGPNFQFYSSGVFTGECGTNLDQGVTVVGYGSENGKLKYWIIKNSWGTLWGEKGYMRLERGVSEKEGLCGIAMEAIYPVA